MLEKCFHFISQSLLTAHLLGRGSQTMTRTGEEHLARLLALPSCVALPSLPLPHTSTEALAWQAAADPEQHLVSDR